MRHLALVEGRSHHLSVTLAQLRAFVAVADYGGFTAAAEQLVMTQSAVSHAIRGLEQELGCKLLLRAGGAVQLTIAGEAALPRARTILAEASALKHEAPMAQAGGTDLRIGSVPSAAERLLPDILTSFKLSNRAVSVLQLTGSDLEVREWLDTSAVEVAILGDTEAGAAEPLIQDELKVVLPKRHQLASNEALSIKDLDGVPFIMSAGGCEPMISALAASHGVQLRVHYDVRDIPSLLKMVADGLGVTIVPELTLPGALENVRILELQPRAYRQLVIATTDDGNVSDVTRSFVRHARRWVLDNHSARAA
jgi:DNA-binding transcriptional LysR family regulator